MNTKIVTAGIIIIGNEILTGRTHDTNSHNIAKSLSLIGVRVQEIQAIPDDIDIIIDRVNDYRARFDYVFTSGGIGPTHDDKTAEAIANAFKTDLILDSEAHKILLDHYGAEDLNDARLKMAYLPKGAELIPNKVSAAPGIKMDNVYVLAGVPSIMRAMMDALLPTLKGGDILHSCSVNCDGVPESVMAPYLEEIEKAYDGTIEIGSYPRLVDGQHHLNIVVRSTDERAMEKAAKEIKNRAEKL